MNIPMIEEPAAQAQKKLLAYREKLRRRADAEYEAIAAGYEAMAQGLPLISLPAALAAGGWDESGNPRLAIARADRERVRYDVRRPWLTFTTLHANANHGGPTLRRSVHLTAMPLQHHEWRDWRSAEAIVPLIPADVRPETGTARDWFILFEAIWRPAPPVDPVLLRHVGGDLYAVLAHWNLTPLEQAVLAGRLEN